MPKVTVNGKVKHLPYKTKEVKRPPGKGTRARLNTAAAKSFFGSRASK